MNVRLQDEMAGAPPRAYRTIDVHPIAGSLGAEISGVDLATDFDDDVTREIRQALLDHLVIFFRDQDLTPEQHIAFARRLGDIFQFPLGPGITGHPEIFEIRKAPEEEQNIGNLWHTDQQWVPEPVMATVLYARQVPEYGGDTMFSNQYLAYETLSDGMKRLVEGMRTVSRSMVDETTEGRHPLVRTHPETGRRALYLGYHVRNFEGMTAQESTPLLEQLIAHSTKPERVCRFRWRPGSLTVWDNRCTQHYAINDYPNQMRLMHRICVAGDVPYFS